MLSEGVAGLILAAGRATRFGSDKRMARLPGDDHTLLEAVLATFTAALAPVFIVLRPADEQAARMAEAFGARPLVCDDADSGMGHSLACGARALQAVDGLQGVLIGLADMPAVSPATLHSLMQALMAQRRAVVPVYQGRLGHPRGLPAEALPALGRLRGDQGARHLLDWQVEAVQVEVDDAGILLDVDTPADLAACTIGTRSTLCR